MPASSPVLAVGTTVINLTPTPVKVWAVKTLGTADKPVLVGSVLVVTLILAGVAGILATRRFAVGATLLTVLVALAGVAAIIQPAAGPLDLLPALAARPDSGPARPRLPGPTAEPLRRGSPRRAGAPPAAASWSARASSPAPRSCSPAPAS